MRGGKWIRVVTSGMKKMISLCLIYATVFTFVQRVLGIKKLT